MTTMVSFCFIARYSAEPFLTILTVTDRSLTAQVSCSWTRHAPGRSVPTIDISLVPFLGLVLEVLEVALDCVPVGDERLLQHRHFLRR